ncbi:MAG: NUDIX domain-containing protein [Candidatus Methylomirabilales bacterium]
MRLREKVLKRRRVYAGNYLMAEQYLVRLPDGSTATRDIVRPPDAVAVVPLDTAGNIYLVRQYRPAVGRLLYELPAGIIDRGESPARTARRECEEEIGLRPKRLRKLCIAYHATGFSTGCVHIYLGTELTPVRRKGPRAAEFVEAFRLPFPRAFRMAISNQIVDAQSLIGLLWAKRLLEKKDP